MPTGYRTRLRHLLFATLIGSLATVARAVAQPFLGDALPFVLAFPATVLTALLWGAIPGIIAAAVCAIGVWMRGIPPTIVESQQPIQFGWFAASTLVTSLACGQLRGSGLGLTQVNGFCIQSGGRISIKSEPGQGTTLCMHLPANLAEAEPAADATAMAAGKLEARLLLVEDNEEVGRTTEQMLQTSGLTVVRVASADAALEYLVTAASPPDIVLSDIAMPGFMNGMGLATELRHLYPKVPVMLHTGYAEQIEEATSQGMRVFQKPVPPSVLIAELRALLLADRNDAEPASDAP